jgi:hypothetical protein
MAWMHDIEVARNESDARSWWSGSLEWQRRIYSTSEPTLVCNSPNVYYISADPHNTNSKFVVLSSSRFCWLWNSITRNTKPHDL